MRPQYFAELGEFIVGWWEYLAHPTKNAFFHFESAKGRLTEILYRQRGRFVRPFVHSGMVGIAAMGVMLAPVISETLPGTNSVLQLTAPSAVLSAATENTELTTLVSDKVRDKVYEHQVREGETVSSIARTFQISEDTILWENNLTKKSVLKPNHKIKILPVTGVTHRVEKGETIYSIAKKHSAEPQAIVDFPFNTFVNDETFALAVGQVLIIPDGAPVKEAPSSVYLARRQTPSAGSVSATGVFVWPTAGVISQGYSWYHKGADVANKAAPDILAADAGTVIVAGWPDSGGYGMRVIVDHGNGFQTLYAHLSQVYVTSGQTVNRGNTIGKMGSTGRSTGTHLHFEIYLNGVKVNPLDHLR